MVRTTDGGGVLTTFGLPLDQITVAQLDSLVTNAVAEGRQLDYKEELPISTDKDKRDFLADVTAFANTAGGDISERRQH